MHRRRSAWKLAQTNCKQDFAYNLSLALNRATEVAATVALKSVA